jgi:Pyruvate/2-oxoacid:ferredoxin oxidoreductase delta subunit
VTGTQCECRWHEAGKRQANFHVIYLILRDIHTLPRCSHVANSGCVHCHMLCPTNSITVSQLLCSAVLYPLEHYRRCKGRHCLERISPTLHLPVSFCPLSELECAGYEPVLISRILKIWSFVQGDSKSIFVPSIWMEKGVPMQLLSSSCLSSPLLPNAVWFLMLGEYCGITLIRW